MMVSDLISRAAAIESFTGKPPEYYHTSYIVGELNSVPAIDAMPVVHGRWKDNGNGTVSCNCCATWFPKTRESQLIFCGYCGAKMDESCVNCACYEEEWEYCFRLGTHVPKDGHCENYRDELPKEK